jgi:hypothetical protein
MLTQAAPVFECGAADEFGVLRVPDLEKAMHYFFLTVRGCAFASSRALFVAIVLAV